ncbi:IS3 family transposase [Carnobacterium antarcticum]|uniref:IS3 family transposase n=1 Tax=Carnobacterium antarcticum TaxID=2126436 RepID=A0ABW4NIS0_9LACT|nr:IS3 family transposase [Carnobacterium sp. CP1]
MTRRPRRAYSEEFKKQIVLLHNTGKSRKEILAEYDLTPSAFDKWVKQNSESGSFREKDNKTPEELELEKLRKRNAQLEMENDIFKASSADIWTKVLVIKNNAHKYAVSAMCQVLSVPRSTYYYLLKQNREKKQDLYTEVVIKIFRDSRENYGTRKIKVELLKKKILLSRRRIGRIMKENGLVSSYTIAQFKPQKTPTNEAKIMNHLNREFNQKEPLRVVVSDLTYVRVGGQWNYVCLFVDLFNREIIGYSAGNRKDAQLVYQALATIKTDLTNIKVFHTDRGNEFDNRLIDDVLTAFSIQRSLSNKGTPYDNAVAEAMFKVFKTEFVRNQHFENLVSLQTGLMDYVHWYNTIRIHGTLNYLTPEEYKMKHLIKSV